jgi:hypothetical protein
MGEDGKDILSGLTPVHQLPDDVQAFIKQENAAAREARERREFLDQRSAHARKVREQMEKQFGKPPGEKEASSDEFVQEFNPKPGQRRAFPPERPK